VKKNKKHDITIVIWIFKLAQDNLKWDHENNPLFPAKE